MKISRKNLLITGLIFLCGACFLYEPKKTSAFAYIGLHTWYENMIVSLFPFMVLMNLLLKSGFSKICIKPFSILLRPFLKNTDYAIFVLFFGFLCGFPLGAKCAVELYKKGELSKENTEYLLAFANNIGPSYMLGFFVAKICPDVPVPAALFILYGIPFIYGLFLRYTIYRTAIDRELYNYTRFCCETASRFETQSLLTVLPDAVSDSLRQIALLGGYMILFNALRIIPHIFFSSIPFLYSVSQSLLEISGGLLCIKQSVSDPVMQIPALFATFSFNGFCCHFQTFSLMQGTALSKQKYMLHKLILCSISVFFIWVFI